jgi:hypothetical protein
MYVDTVQSPSSPSPFVSNVIRLPRLERGDEGGYGPTWDGVHLVMGDIISWTPLESRTVHAFQDVCIFVKYFTG